MSKLDLWNRAVDRMREDDDSRWHAVADWLRLEAATQAEMEPFVEVLNAAIKLKSGVKGVLRFGRNADGEPDLFLDTSEGATAVALAYLGESK